MTTRVTFAVDHTTDGGRTYKQGNTYEVNDADAREIIYNAKGVDAGPAPEPADPPAATAKPRLASRAKAKAEEVTPNQDNPPSDESGDQSKEG